MKEIRNNRVIAVFQRRLVEFGEDKDDKFKKGFKKSKDKIFEKSP